MSNKFKLEILPMDNWLESIGCDRTYRKDMKDTYEKIKPELKAQAKYTAGQAINEAEKIFNLECDYSRLMMLKWKLGFALSKREFLALPMNMRREILGQQAEQLVEKR